MPTVYEEQNIKHLNKARRSITNVSFCLRLHHGKAGLLILLHCSFSPSPMPHTESPTKPRPSPHLQCHQPYALSLC